jgi:WD40 repeat protein
MEVLPFSRQEFLSVSRSEWVWNGQESWPNRREYLLGLMGGGFCLGASSLWGAVRGAEAVPRRLDGHSDNVYALVSDSQGRWLASISEDATVRIWDWAEGKLRHRLRGEDAFYDAVVIPIEGHLLVSDGGGRLHRFDPVTGRALHRWKSHDDPIYALALSSDGQLLAAGGGEHDPVCRLWSLSGGPCLRTLEGHGDALYGLAFSPDGRWLASASADRTVRLWNPTTGQLRAVLKHDNYVYRCRFAPRQPILATACHDKRLRLWNVETGQCVATFTEAKGPLFTVAFSPDGRHLLAAGEDRKVRVYDWNQRQCLGVVAESKDVLYALGFTGGAEPMLATAGGDSRIHLFPWQPRQLRP